MLQLLVVFSVLPYFLAVAAISVTLEEDAHTIIIKATQKADKVKLSAVIESLDGLFRDNNISTDSQLVLHYPQLDFRKGFHVAYTISYVEENEKKFDVGTFTFNGGSPHKRNSRSVHNFGFYDNTPKFGWPSPGNQHIGAFPRDGSFPSHGPPPFFKPTFPFHGGWQNHHHGGEDCDWPHHEWNQGVHKSTHWPKIDDDDDDNGKNENDNEVKPNIEFTTTPVPTTTTPESTTQPKIDIRFGNK